MTYPQVLTALADPTRRGIFESLRSEECSVALIASRHPVSRPAVSQHLKVLQRAGLVRVREQGTRRLYSVRRDGLDELRRYIDGFWSDALAAYADEVRKQAGSEP